jgi:hypothetical protein
MPRPYHYVSFAEQDAYRLALTDVQFLRVPNCQEDHQTVFRLKYDLGLSQLFKSLEKRLISDVERHYKQIFSSTLPVEMIESHLQLFKRLRGERYICIQCSDYIEIPEIRLAFLYNMDVHLSGVSLRRDKILLHWQVHTIEETDQSLLRSALGSASNEASEDESDSDGEGAEWMGPDDEELEALYAAFRKDLAELDKDIKECRQRADRAAEQLAQLETITNTHPTPDNHLDHLYYQLQDIRQLIRS